MSINGVHASNTTFMAPGWAFEPTVRVLYEAYDVTSLLRPAETNVVGVRLGFCKYGYQNAFCDGAHGSLATCRAFILQLSVRYSDGSRGSFFSSAPNNVSRTSASSNSTWIGTTASNPLQYTHLYHGEIYDARIEDQQWDTTASRNSSSSSSGNWEPAQRSALSSQLGGLQLHAFPAMAITGR